MSPKGTKMRERVRNILEIDGSKGHFLEAVNLEIKQPTF